MLKKTPIRIAHIMGKLWAGGVEAVVFNYYRQIDKTKVQFDFFYDADSTVEPPQELIDMGARFYKVPPYQHLPRYLSILGQYFKQNDYNIVHSHINTLSVFPLFAAWKAGIPVRIAHNHSVPGGDEFRRNILKLTLRKFAKIFPTDYFACSEEAGRWLFGDKAFEEGKINLVKNAIDFEKFKTNEQLTQLYKNKFNLEGKFVIGHVGRFTYAKNHQFLLEIFAAILKKRKDSILLLIGDGELHKEIDTKIHKLGIKNYVVMTGQVSNPQDYYGLIDVLVMPSFFEGLPLTLIEGQSAGIPAVVSEVIPIEASISNACIFLNINENTSRWVDAVLKMDSFKVILNEHSEEYNIKITAPQLLDWYQKRINNINDMRG